MTTIVIGTTPISDSNSSDHIYADELIGGAYGSK